MFFRGSIETLTYTIIAAELIEAGQLVSYADKAAGAGVKVHGIAVHDAEKGEALRIVVIGQCDLAAGGTIAKGQSLVSDAAGRPVAAVSDAAPGIFGVALSNAALDERVAVLIR